MIPDDADAPGLSEAREKLKIDRILALDSATHKPYRGENGKWVIYNCTEASDFDQVMSGGNTSYCDDPEECMADNFAFAMSAYTDVPNQKLLRDIIATLLKYNNGVW